jgi:tetratricopeptide (TPR) repeat protein
MDREITSSPESQRLQEHPLYVRGIGFRDAGQWQKALEIFQLLQGVYPDEPELKEIHDQVQMRATMAHFQAANSPRASRRITSRKFMLSLFLLFVIIGAGYVAYEFWINPVIIRELRVRQIAGLRGEADEAIAAGDYARARLILQELSEKLPADPDTTELLQRIERVERSVVLYAEASALIDEAEWDQAVQVLAELQRLDAQYRDVPHLLEVTRTSLALEQKFQAAESAFDAQDWDTAIASYESLRQTNLGFRFEDVQTRMFETHLRYGQSLAQQAGTDPMQIEGALSHFSAALQFKPLDPETLKERYLAETYLGALNSSDQDEVIELLQVVYNEKPGYADQSAAQLLYDTLLQRANSTVGGGDVQAGIADYQIAAQLAVEDSTEAEEKLIELTSGGSP